MRKRWPILLLILIAGIVRATDYSDCFIPGETSEYKVSWMGVPLAWSKNTNETVEENGRKLICIRTVSKSYKAFAKIYKVEMYRETTATKVLIRLRIICLICAI